MEYLFGFLLGIGRAAIVVEVGKPGIKVNGRVDKCRISRGQVLSHHDRCIASTCHDNMLKQGHTCTGEGIGELIGQIKIISRRNGDSARMIVCDIDVTRTPADSIPEDFPRIDT